MCVCVCVSARRWPRRAEESDRSPGARVTGISVSCPKWILGTELGYSALNRLAISLALRTLFGSLNLGLLIVLTLD